MRRDAVLLTAVTTVGIAIPIFLILTSPAEFSHATGESPYISYEFPAFLGLSILLGFLRPHGPLWLDVVLVLTVPSWIVEVIWAQVIHADFNDPIIWAAVLLFNVLIAGAENFIGRGARLGAHLLWHKLGSRTNYSDPL